MVNLRSLWNPCRTAALIVCLGLLAGCATDPAPKKTANTDSASKKADNDPLSKQARQMHKFQRRHGHRAFG